MLPQGQVQVPSGGACGSTGLAALLAGATAARVSVLSEDASAARLGRVSAAGGGRLRPQIRL